MDARAERTLIAAESGLLTFGWVLGAVREELGISQRQLAGETGFDKGYLSRLETDDRLPNHELIDTMATRLQLRPSWEAPLWHVARLLPCRVSMFQTYCMVVGRDGAEAPGIG